MTGATSCPTAKQISVLKIVADWADRFICIRNIFVFGSFARGEQSPDDIDIAVEYTEDVFKRAAVQCYTDVNACSMDLERALSKVVPVPVGWTGLLALTDGYDGTAWAAIHEGRLIHRCRKAQMIWTKPRASSQDIEAFRE
jgi:predicted nucleotidyltransferase